MVPAKRKAASKKTSRSFKIFLMKVWLILTWPFRMVWKGIVWLARGIAIIAVAIWAFIKRHKWWVIGFLLLVIVGLIVWAFIWALNWSPKTPATNIPTVTEQALVIPPASTKVPPTEAPTAVPPAATNTPVATESTPEALRLTAGVYLDWTKDADKYRQSDGMYLVPIDDLRAMGSGAPAIVFEGEYAESVGKHSICFVTGEVPIRCNQNNGMMHINQGSFWAYQSNPKGDLPDDLLMVFSHDKWKNWYDQKIEGNPIEVFTSTGIVVFPGGKEPVLTPAQVLIADRNAAERCPAGQAEKLENPYSDATGQSSPIVVGAPGSFACRTLFVGKVSSDGDLVAYYWRGARDGFTYVAKATNFYLVPESWGETEMKAFVATLGNAKFLGQAK